MIYYRHGGLNLIFILGFLTSLVSSHDSRFDRFFPVWSHYLSGYRDNNCTLERDAYYTDQVDPNFKAVLLADCMLKCMAEYIKVEMVVVSLIFGLLPSTLFLIGPTQDEIAVLALRRPFLITLAGISMPSLLLPDGTTSDLELRLSRSVDPTFRPWNLAVPPIWLTAMVSACEYILAGLAVANTVYQAYQLAFWSISISSMALVSGPLPKTYGPFLWGFLTILVYIMNFGAFCLTYKENRKRHTNWRGNLSRLFGNEITPCMYGKPMSLTAKRRTYHSMIASFFVNAGVIFLLVYSTILLSSQIFISLGDAVPVLARYFAGSLVCRGIMEFELRGMREAGTSTKSCQDQAPLTSPEVDGT